MRCHILDYRPSLHPPPSLTAVTEDPFDKSVSASALWQARPSGAQLVVPEAITKRVHHFEWGAHSCPNRQRSQPKREEGVGRTVANSAITHTLCIACFVCLFCFWVWFWHASIVALWEHWSDSQSRLTDRLLDDILYRHSVIPELLLYRHHQVSIWDIDQTPAKLMTSPSVSAVLSIEQLANSSLLTC